MAKALGTTSVVKVDISSTLTAVEKLVSTDFSHSTNPVDATDNDTSGYEEFLPGNSSGSFSFTYNYDTAKPSGQAQVAALSISKAIEEWRFEPNGNTVGADRFDFSGFVSELSAPSSNDTTLEWSATVQITGVITRTTIT